MLHKLICLANALDMRGLTKESDIVDNITAELRKIYKKLPRDKTMEKSDSKNKNAVKIDENLSEKEIMDQYHCSRTTAWRAKKRG